jgi:hypothetical protein
MRGAVWMGKPYPNNGKDGEWRSTRTLLNSHRCLGNNLQKRTKRKADALAKGMPGGWKKIVRIWDETARMLNRGVEQQRARLAEK